MGAGIVGFGKSLPRHPRLERIERAGQASCLHPWAEKSCGQSFAQSCALILALSQGDLPWRKPLGNLEPKFRRGMQPIDPPEDSVPDCVSTRGKPIPT
jgi:hypothetical protein